LFEEVPHAGVAVVRELIGNLATEAPPLARLANVLFPVPVASLSLSPAVDPIHLADDSPVDGKGVVGTIAAGPKRPPALSCLVQFLGGHLR